MKINLQRGTALISAILITAIAAVLATTTLWSLKLLVRQATLNINSDQMYEYLIGVNDWAKMTILTENNLTQVHSLNISINNTHVAGKIYAEQGLFNINSLQDTQNEAGFANLLSMVAPDIAHDKALAIAQAINHWVGSATSSNDDIYLALHPPYRAAHRWFTVTSELRLVVGIDARTYEKLSPYITALPTTQNLIDINYAPLPVFFTLNDKMTLAQAKSLYACRHEQGFFTNIADFIKICADSQEISINHAIVNGNYYLVHATATQDTQKLLLTSLLLKYQSANNQDDVKIAWQQLNIEK